MIQIPGPHVHSHARSSRDPAQKPRRRAIRATASDVEGYPDGLSNFGDASYPQVDLVQATAKSVNTVYVPLGLDAGLENVVSTAYDLGIPESSELEAVPSITLGTQFVRPVDMAAVFATFASGGEQADPYLVAEVSRDGERLFRHEAEVERALEADVAADVTHALQAVLGPGGTAAAAAIGRPAAGKTGTTTDNTAAWFVGATPPLSTAVALFGPKPADRLRIDGVREVTGGSFPARLWDAYMTSALDGSPVEAFPPPAYVGEERGASPSPAPPAPSTTAPGSPPKKDDEPRGEPGKPGKGKKGKGGG